MFAFVAVWIVCLYSLRGIPAQSTDDLMTWREDREMGLDDFIDSLRKRYEARFERHCRKYPFVKRYEDMLRNPPGRYLWFVVQEKGQPPGATGGLGDRLAGLVTATAYALRNNRTLLIDGEPPFNELFVPRRPADFEDSITYKNWSWSGWKPHFADTMHWERCVNPRPSAVPCAKDRANDEYQTIKYYGNRSYLCRWLALRNQLGISEELKQILDISVDANLYEISGCLMRMAIHPSELLWSELRKLMREANQQKERLYADTRLVSMHFRCGDSSFSEGSVPKINPECFYTSNETWKGTNFGDDMSWSSPIDLARCAQRLLQRSDRDFINIASDNVHSARQMKEKVRTNRVFTMPRACHMDLKHSAADCATSTLTQWFLLSLSDFIVTQPLSAATESGYRDRLESIAMLQGTSVVDTAPISAFSRTASMYGLETNHLRYGDSCRELNITSMGHHSHGNWVCQPPIFYRYLRG